MLRESEIIGPRQPLLHISLGSCLKSALQYVVGVPAPSAWMSLTQRGNLVVLGFRYSKDPSVQTVFEEHGFRSRGH